MDQMSNDNKQSLVNDMPQFETDAEDDQSKSGPNESRKPPIKVKTRVNQDLHMNDYEDITTE